MAVTRSQRTPLPFPIQSHIQGPHPHRRIFFTPPFQSHTQDPLPHCGMVYWTSTVLPGRLYVSGSAPLHVLSTPFLSLSLSLSLPLMSLPTKYSPSPHLSSIPTPTLITHHCLVSNYSFAIQELKCPRWTSRQLTTLHSFSCICSQTVRVVTSQYIRSSSIELVSCEIS